MESLSSLGSNVTTIVLLGFHDTEQFNWLFFTLILLIYCVTICGNLLILTLVSYSKTLHTPMYFFLTQLSIGDIMLTSDITPNMLNIILHGRSSITFSGCITQFFFFGTIEVFECLLLMVMSIDRYLAICSPLRYVSVMSQRLCNKFVFGSWLLSSSITLNMTIGISQLNFCGPNTIDHFFCDLSPLLELSCSDTSMVQIVQAFLAIPVTGIPFLLIVFSYTKIIFAIIQISSLSGRLKVFSTCSSHLTVVSIFYGSLTVMYILPNKGHSVNINKVLAMVYTVFTPFMNSLIYSLRNKDINDALRNVLYHKPAHC
ncbi:olfactory receptor 11L1-like [Gastrophryne carolinensis]